MKGLCEVLVLILCSSIWIGCDRAGSGNPDDAPGGDVHDLDMARALDGTLMFEVLTREPDTTDTDEPMPCISVTPQAVDFGCQLVRSETTRPVRIHSCGSTPLQIYNASFMEGSSDDFNVLLHPTPEEPVIVPGGEEVTLDLSFTPDEENPIQDGVPVPDTGTLVIESNAQNEDSVVFVSGWGDSYHCCPTAVIQVAEGNEVTPQTALHLYGDQSWASTGTIAKWDWSVDQPPGSQSMFIPSSTFPNVTFEVNAEGVYTFSLTVYDEENFPSCAPDTFEVAVIPDIAIRVELLWHTPGDPDETDEGPEAGANLDLHFTHPWAGGPDRDGDGHPDGWFDQPFDCFWFNAHPEWGSFDPSVDDNPSLDCDDTDGAGPENITLNVPEEVVYRVGVHYWNDQGYGESYATVRVYVDSLLAMEVADVELVDSDMWEVCTIDWPSGAVQVVEDSTGQYKITPDYQNPFFFQD